MQNIRAGLPPNTKSKSLFKSLTVSALCGSCFFINSAIAGTTISAPLFPLMAPGLTEHSGSNYPKTANEQLEVAKLYHLSFESVKEKCSTLVSDVESSDEQVVENYKAVAKCSYTELSAKPYYIPQLVNDVDMCKEILGLDYRMITEQDIKSFSDTFYSELNNVFTNAVQFGDDHFYPDFYFSRATYIRNNAGELKIGNLYPHVVNDRVTDIEGVWDFGDDKKQTPDWKKLLLESTLDIGGTEGATEANMQDVKVGLRCILNE